MNLKQVFGTGYLTRSFELNCYSAHPTNNEKYSPDTRSTSTRTPLQISYEYLYHTNTRLRNSPPGPKTVAQTETLVAVAGGTLSLGTLSNVGDDTTLVFSVTVSCGWNTASSSAFATPLAHLHKDNNKEKYKDCW